MANEKTDKNVISLNTDYNIIANKNANFTDSVKVNNNLTVGNNLILENHLYAKSIETEKLTVNEDSVITDNFILQKLEKKLQRDESDDESDIEKNNKNITILLCEENSDIHLCGTFLIKYNTDALDFNKIDIKLSKPQDNLSCCITNCTSKIENYEITKHTYNSKNYYTLSLTLDRDITLDVFDIWFYGFVFNSCDEFGTVLYSDDNTLNKVDVGSITYEKVAFSGALALDKNYRVLDVRDDQNIRDVISSNYNTLNKKIDDEKTNLNKKIDQTKQDLIDKNIVGYQLIESTMDVYPIKDMKYITRNNINLGLRIANVPNGTVVDVYSINTTSVGCYENGGWLTLTPGTRGRYIYFEGRWRQFGMYGAVWNDN